MHLKNGRSAGNGAYTWKGTTLRLMVANRPKISFWSYGSTNLGNYGYTKIFVLFSTKQFFMYPSYRATLWIPTSKVLTELGRKTTMFCMYVVSEMQFYYTTEEIETGLRRVYIITLIGNIYLNKKLILIV
jgi:hypothetical protein